MSPTEVKVKPVESPAPSPVGTGEPSQARQTGKARPLVPPRVSANSKRQTKVLLSVTDGEIEWEKMDPAARKKFQELFSNPEFLKQFGLLPKGGDTFDPDQVKFLYDALGTAYASIFRFLKKWPPEALKLLAYTEDQKELLKEPTANLLNKLAPAVLMKNQELLIFGVMFFAQTQQNFVRATQTAALIRRAELEKARAVAAASPHATIETEKITVIPPPKPNGAEFTPIQVGVGPIPRGDLTSVR